MIGAPGPGDTLRQRPWCDMPSSTTSTLLLTRYLVEKVIRKEKRGRVMWCLVKWYGYPTSMNSWVRQRDIRHVTNRQQL